MSSINSSTILIENQMSAPTTCPRCKNEMICRPSDINNCPCSKVAVSEHLQSFLSKTSYACLCNNCLQELKALIAETTAEKIDLVSGQLKKGRHYYIDNEQYVFTEYYHIQRGTCCENHCRHCAYGIDQVG